jgi:hypothetical protein
MGLNFYDYHDFQEVFSENSVLTYSLYSRAAYDGARMVCTVCTYLILEATFGTKASKAGMYICTIVHS